MLEHRTTIKVTNEIFEKIDSLAKQQGQTRSGLIRTAIVNYLKEWGGFLG